MQHGLIVEQRVERYESCARENIEGAIKEGWRVVTLACTPAGNIFVVYERFVTTCGEQVTCLGCLASE